MFILSQEQTPNRPCNSGKAGFIDNYPTSLAHLPSPRGRHGTTATARCSRHFEYRSPYLASLITLPPVCPDDMHLCFQHRRSSYTLDRGSHRWEICLLVARTEMSVIAHRSVSVRSSSDARKRLHRYGYQQCQETGMRPPDVPIAHVEGVGCRCCHVCPLDWRTVRCDRPLRPSRARISGRAGW